MIQYTGKIFPALVAGMLGASVLVAPVSWSQDGGAEGRDASRISARDAAGHRRMLEELSKVAQRDRLENEYLGESELRECRARLEEVSEAEPLERLQLCYAVGTLELQAGNNEEAVAKLEEAYRLLESFPVETYPKLHIKVVYRLALAYLRLGETQNCVAHHTSRSCLLPIAADGVHVDQDGSRTAIRYLAEVIACAERGSPAEVCSRWLMNVAYMTIGEYPDGVPPEELIPPEVFASDEAFPRFEEIAPELGLASFNLAGGALIEDFDGDGSLDVLTSTWDSSGSMHLACRQADGTFVDRTEEAGLDGLYGGLNMVPADYDGDGDVDVLVLRGGWISGTAGQQPNSLLRNEGGGFFTDVTFNAGLGEHHYPTQTGAWADYDNDGDLDLYVGNEATSVNRHPGQLFRNDGDGTFTDVAAEAGVENVRYAKGVVWGDYDGDRLPDLYVSNLGSWNRLYHNDGDGTFTDVAAEAGVRGPFESFTCWFWDYDNDGALDLYVSTYHQGGPDGMRLYPVVASVLGIPQEAELACLYKGDGKGGFRDVASESRLTKVTLTMGANFGDLDNDGFLDFYLGTGYPGYDGLTPNVMYHNRRGRDFADVTTAGGFGHVQKGHAVTFGDLDEDGDLDVFEQMGGAYPGDAFGNVLYENPGFGNHWIELRLAGEESNRMGVGAHIRVDVVEDGKPRTIHREVTSGGSFGGNPFLQHVGLGSADLVERLEVFWPTTGTRQVFEKLAVDRRYAVIEGRPDLVTVPTRPRPFQRPER